MRKMSAFLSALLLFPAILCFGSTLDNDNVGYESSIKSESLLKPSLVSCFQFAHYSSIGSPSEREQNQNCHPDRIDVLVSFRFLNNAGRNNRLPYVLYDFKEKSEEDRPRLGYVYIIGGPLGRFSYSLINNPIASVARPGDKVVVPLYFGTSYRSTGSATKDMLSSVGEIDSLLNYLRNTNPDVKWTVIGESFGSYAASRVKRNFNETLILISPPLGFSASDINAFYLQNSSAVTLQTEIIYVSFLDPRVLLPVRKLDYLREIGESFNEEKFVKAPTSQDGSCSIVVYGIKDPLFLYNPQRFHKEVSHFDARFSINSGHDVFLTGRDLRSIMEQDKKNRCFY